MPKASKKKGNKGNNTATNASLRRVSNSPTEEKYVHRKRGPKENNKKGGEDDEDKKELITPQGPPPRRKKTFNPTSPDSLLSPPLDESPKMISKLSVIVYLTS